MIEAAKRRIAEHGLDKLTLKAVAEEAKVTQGTVYYHFGQRAACFEVVRDLCRASWERLKANEKPAAERIKDGLSSAKSRTLKDAYYHQLF
ncbi:helix-turn-helix domain containing protein [Bacillus licheniformis]|nr:helix-turn-helix domain containing protein [Bacillus licheniformis]